MKSYNYKHVDTTCPECKHTEILNDPEHENIYCTSCGLILEENVIFRITEYIETEKQKENNIRKLHHRRIKLNGRIKI